MIRWFILALVVAAFSPVANAEPAKDSAHTAWTPTACGEEPDAPSIDLSSRTKYNESVERVTQYETKAQAYNTCVRKEAKTQMDAINNTANSIQKKIWGNFDHYTSEFKAAEAKFKAQQ